MHSMAKIITSIFLICIASYLSSCQSSHILCDGKVVVDSKLPLKFSKNELQLLCGDKDVSGWKNVPLAQTELTIKEFLKARGYYEAKFELQEDKQLHITAGTIYKVKDVVFSGAPEDFYDVKFIGWKNKNFTGGTLDDIENWTKRRLKSIGYACAEVKLQAIIETGIVEVHIFPGEKYVFPEITYDEDPEKTINPKVLERFYAFTPGELFNEELLSLSSRRIENDAVVSHSNFIVTCEEENLSIKQTVNPGTSHLFKVGAGISTEEFPIAKISWKDSRIGNNASILYADAYASHLRQIVQLGFEWHPFPRNRWFMTPSIEGRRIDEDDQKYYDLIFYNPVGTRHDFSTLRVEFKTGPGANFENAQEGPTTGRKDFGLWRSSIEFTGHDYEVFMNDPRRGFRIGLETSSVLLSSVDQVWANKISLNGTRLWNLLNFGPPKYVFGLRFGLDSVVAKENNVRNNLPQSYFTWLGGDTSVRGFSRRELPDEDIEIGTLSSFYTGAEIRFASLLMKGLDPFIFTDAGMLGKENFNFDKTVYWSPGVGLRYQSFIGVVRGTIARGFITGAGDPNHEHFQYFLSLGREF